MAKQIEFELERVKLNKGGYDCSGQYYGSGMSLFRAAAEVEVTRANGIYQDIMMEFRAEDRNAAKDILRDKYPLAKIPR